MINEKKISDFLTTAAFFIARKKKTKQENPKKGYEIIPNNIQIKTLPSILLSDCSILFFLAIILLHHCINKSFLLYEQEITANNKVASHMLHLVHFRMHFLQIESRQYHKQVLVLDIFHYNRLNNNTMPYRCILI